MGMAHILTIVFFGVLAVLFAGWLLLSSALSLPGVLAALISLLLFSWAGYRLIGPAWEFVSTPEPMEPARPMLRKYRRERMHPWLRIVLLALASQICTYVIAYGIDLAINGYQGGILDRLYALLVRTDAPHYLGLAENWYVTTGDARFHIVFFPLYPILVRGFSFLTGNTFAASLLVSNLCFMGAAVLLYELTLKALDRAAALRAVTFLLLLPAGFFFGAPMTESLFLLLCLASLYCARTHRFLLAGVFGMLASFTRSPGLLLMLPIGMEAVRDLVGKRRDGLTGRPWAMAVTTKGLCVLMALLGFAAYLWVNASVTGNPWQFTIYQSEHWNQRMGLFFSTASYQTEHALSALESGDLRMLFGLWLPNLLYKAAALVLMGLCAKRLRASYGVFALGYFFIVMGATWLLSAPRYLAGLCVLPMMLACLTRRTRDNVIGILLCALGSLTYLFLFIAGYPVY